MTQKLYIPKKIKIGFQNREDTFTKKLGYVVYFDQKGVLRKETSWNSWRDKKIEPIEFDNVPTPNFVLNKGVRRYSDWGSGRSVIRIYDPRDFEFEISVDNLLGILSHSDVSRRDIAESCVFAWAGTELVLLPTNSEEYQDSLKYTKRVETKFSARSLVPGMIYAQKRDEQNLTYIGYMNYIEDNLLSYQSKTIDKGKKHVFRNYIGEFVTPAPTSLANQVGDEIDPDFSNYVEEYQKSLHWKKPVSLEIGPGSVCSGYNNQQFAWFRKEGTSILKVSYSARDETALNVHDDYWSSIQFQLLSLSTTESGSEISVSYPGRPHSHAYSNSSLNFAPRKELVDLIGSNGALLEGKKAKPNDVAAALTQLGYQACYLVLDDGSKLQYTRN